MWANESLDDSRPQPSGLQLRLWTSWNRDKPSSSAVSEFLNLWIHESNKCIFYVTIFRMIWEKEIIYFSLVFCFLLTKLILTTLQFNFFAKQNIKRQQYGCNSNLKTTGATLFIVSLHNRHVSGAPCRHILIILRLIVVDFFFLLYFVSKLI